MAELVRPGVLGRLIRLVMAGAVGWLGFETLRNSRGFWDGIGPDPQFVPMVIVLLGFTGWVVSELAGRNWGMRPTFVMLAACGIAAAVGAAQGDVWGPPLGIVFWAWGVLFSLLLAPAFLLAAVLGTPGCEMRSYADLWTRLRGGDPATVVCPGWIDRLDGVRVFGK